MSIAKDIEEDIEVEKKWHDYFNEFALTHCKPETRLGFYLARFGRITVDFFRKHKDELDIDELCGSMHTFITLQDLLDNPDLPWMYNSYIHNDKMTWSDYIENASLPWGDEIPVLKGVTLDIIKSHPEVKWKYSGYNCIANSGILTEEFLEANFDKPWDWQALSINKNISPEFKAKHADKPWTAPPTWAINNNVAKIKYDHNTGMRTLDNECLFEALANKTIDSYWFAECCNFDIDRFFALDDAGSLQMNEEQLKIFYMALSGNPCISLERHFLPRKDLPYWSMDKLTHNRQVTLDFIRAHPVIGWNYDFFSDNPNVTEELIDNNPNFQWDYTLLSNNQNISWNYIRQHLDKPWCFAYVINKDLLFSEIIEYKQYFGDEIDDIEPGCFVRERARFIAELDTTTSPH